MKNILMLDDDLMSIKENGATIERDRLQPWLRWMKRGGNQGKIHLIEAQNLAQFVAALQERENEPENGGGYIHGIIVDIYWELTSKAEKTFARVGFPDVPIASTEAGEQLLRLMFDPNRRHNLVPAVAKHTDRQFAVLSNIRGVEMGLQLLTDKVRILNKSKETVWSPNASKSIEVPSQDFRDWVNKL